jgi:photosystem II stability/assembly factor-like uncharacterized protein
MKFFIFLAALMLLFFCCKKNNTVRGNWKTLHSSKDYRLTNAVFEDSLKGYVLGGNIWFSSVVLSTKDGGKTWNIDSLPAQMFFANSYSNDKQLYASSLEGGVWALNEGTHTWENKINGTGARSNSVAFWNKNLGFVATGAAFQYGKIIRYKQNYQQDTIFDYEQELKAVCFSDSLTVHAVGYGMIIRSTDAGKSWVVSPSKDDFFQSICFPSAKVGYTVGSIGSIFKTTNSGESWQALREGGKLSVSDIGFRAVHFCTEQQGAIVGDAGTVWTTQNGGVTWINHTDLPSLNYYGVFCLPNKAIVVGEQGIILAVEY